MDKSRNAFKGALTNEKLKLRFTSQFDLVNYAIRLAAEMIQSGRPPRVNSDLQNAALVIMQELNAGKDQFDDFEDDEPIDESDLKAFVKSSIG